MQSQNPEVSGVKAITGATVPEQARPRMAGHPLDLPAMCDICGKARSTQKHARCSKARQRRKSKEWESYMANMAAKRAMGGRRYAR
ncbi:hypothetical protein [Pseudomonas monteilii]|uniref:hypothetical protein n=1 Tax=Pseudomonas monteilii TaxID=76759 RepID=UPI00383BE55C